MELGIPRRVNLNMENIMMNETLYPLLMILSLMVRHEP
jgi:hypothetical protein